MRYINLSNLNAVQTSFHGGIAIKLAPHSISFRPGLTKRVFEELGAMNQITFSRLFPQGYKPGLFTFGEHPHIGEAANIVERYRDAFVRGIVNPGQIAEFNLYSRLIEAKDLSRHSDITIAEVMGKLARSIFGDSVDQFKGPNEKADRIGRELVSILPKDMSWKDWMVTLSASNALELFSTKPKWDYLIDDIRRVSENPGNFKLGLDASDLFIERVISRPQKIAFFPDNFGEVRFDLQFLLKLAEHYEKISPDGDWTISVVPKSVPSTTDATYTLIDNIINEENSSVAGLKRIIDKGKFKVFDDGPKAQGTFAPHLSQEIGNYLVDLIENDGTAIAKGLYNLESIQGLNIPIFMFFKSKTDRSSKASGLNKDEFGLAYLPPTVKGVEGFLKDKPDYTFSDLLNTVKSDKYQSILTSFSGNERSAVNFIHNFMEQHHCTFVEAVDRINI